MKEQTAALLNLLEQEGRSIHALLFRLTLRQDVAEDLMQDLFLRLFRTPGFAEARDQAAYLRRAALNLALDWRRTHKSVVPLEQLPEEPAGQDTSPLGQLVRMEQWNEILDAACQLTDLCRDAFLLRFVQQESYEAIALQMGKTPHQVRALCHKAVDQCRQLLARRSQRLPPGREESHASY